MHDGGLNGHSPSIDQPQPHDTTDILVNDTSRDIEHASIKDEDGSYGSPVPNHETATNGFAVRDGSSAPPSKKRKLADTNGHAKASPRPVSPPWKRSGTEGPTSFLENGRRKSGRTNVVPLELQPNSGKRQTRAAFDRSVGDQKMSKPSYSLSTRKAHVAQQPKKVETPLVKRTLSQSAKRPENVSPSQPRKKPGPKPKPKPSSPTSTRLQELEAQLAALQRQQSRQSRSNGHLKRETVDSESDSHSDAEKSPEQPTRAISTPLTVRKVNFRVHLPGATIVTPANRPSVKKYASFEEFLDKDDTEYRLGSDIMTPEQIEKEASIRHRVWKAQRPGGLLHHGGIHRSNIMRHESDRHYSHQDHLLAHAVYFRKLMVEEHRVHRKRAEILAHEAKRYVEAKALKNRVKTKEELEFEELQRRRAVYKSVVKDVEKLWTAVATEVQAMRLKEYEEQQQAENKRHLERVLDRTTQMLNRDAEDSILDSAEVTDDASGSEGENASENSEEMSESESEQSSGGEHEDDDAGLTVEQLREKYGAIPELEADTPDPDTAMSSMPPSIAGDNDEDESDRSTEMDSEFDTDESDDDNDDGDSEEEEDEGSSLLGMFFTKKEIKQAAQEDDSSSNVLDKAPEEDAVPDDHIDEDPPNVVKPVVDEIVEDTDVAMPDATTVPNESADLPLTVSARAQGPTETAEIVPVATEQPPAQADGSPSSAASPHTTATKASAPESVSSVESHTEEPAQDVCVQPTSDVKTPVPRLLRGTLRTYQHEGLDWLATLYANGRSGILADEMGLGKTIQSIALLAHLAEVHEVWGPHLIVVPTSVMLNWEMEFKKFLPGFKVLTYYGSIEERKNKRRGWLQEDSFNVCITSYQLVLQDQSSFKRRRWQYMILDEAHNIKNFRSDRWQTMMTFNTQARLLLTGTPLQNNLTELWSLLFFLHYGQETEGEDDAFAGLKEWSEWFKRPVDSILEHNKQVLDDQDKEQIGKLHKVIRPFLLRRLKADVEKQMPLKYEHVEMCRLSKRQRQLYDGFMSRAQTKETLASGNYLSIINALMQLRKVCNHPDLFETRPINTSFAMPKSVAAEFEIRDLLVRRRSQKALAERVNLDFLQLVPICHEDKSHIEYVQSTRRHAFHQIKALRDKQATRLDADKMWHGEDRVGVLASLENVGRVNRHRQLDQLMYQEAYRHHAHPVFGRGLIQKLTCKTTYDKLASLSGERVMTRFWERENPVESLSLVQSIENRSKIMEPLVKKYGCITPGAVANDMAALSVTDAGAVALRSSAANTALDPFHEAQMKLSIAFPDKRLLQYDCGKLQRLDKLLRKLQSGGHRALIFTQMTKVLDILEQFLNIHGHRYLRLDGATKIEQRQLLTERFNNDTRILAFILSSRSGGLGINLTGADTVIFYDLDWNPAMDKQCTDRAHRIGQTRDVHIYRFVSEHTIESNILRKANQKQLLDDVVIQEGDFTTDYLNKSSYRDMLDETAEDDVAGAAMDRVLGNERANVTAFEQAEEKEDIAAAKVAAREVQHADDGDFEDKGPATESSSKAQTPGPFGATNAALDEADASDERHIDDYMIKFQRYLLKDVPLAPAKDRSKKGKRRRDEHRTRRAR